jgi:HD superfamily phosphohydrolase
MKAQKRIRTILYGDQRISGCELEVLHTPSMQRLYGLRQLGLTDRVFIDASHSRLHHVVGVLEQVDKLVSAITANLEKSSRTFRFGASRDTQVQISATQLSKIVEKRKPVIRFIGLLHDLTHAPFGHTVEDEIGLVKSKHDEPDRQADACYRLFCQLVAWLTVEAGGLRTDRAPALPEAMRPFLSLAAEDNPPEPDLVGAAAKRLLESVDATTAKACWRLRHQDIAMMFAHLNGAMTALLHLEALHKNQLELHHLPRSTPYEFQMAIQIALSGTKYEVLLEEFRFDPHRDAYMLDIVGNTVCADLLDYAQRDSHFAGLRLDYDPDRIAENFTLVGWDASAYELERTGKRREVPEGQTDPFTGWCLRTAISLFSHKYRTDVPGELMNLLNVRFYLYERVIYHPTKCASGAMLGTALQMLGWRKREKPKGPQLPKHLRFASDEVFLHDIRAAARFLEGWCRQHAGTDVIGQKDVDGVALFDQTHSGLVSELLRLRIGDSVSEAAQELSAARLLLDRLAARRYMRPVFRALPSSKDLRLQVGAAGLAAVFLDPDVRYETERRIESEASLPPGSVVIHCPRRKTAEKIANVLLVHPGQGDVDETCKLRDIHSLDAEIFGEHEHAIKAVEQMYASMWRLLVYATSESLTDYKSISEVAGRVIFETIDTYGQFADTADVVWKNDTRLEVELDSKLGESKGSFSDPDQFELTTFGHLVGTLSDELVRGGFIPPELTTTVSTSVMKAKLAGALKSALGSDVPQAQPGAAQAEPDSMTRFLKLAKVYARPSQRKLNAVQRRYEPVLNAMAPTAAMRALAGLEAAVNETPRGLTERKGGKLAELLDVWDEQLRANGAEVANDRDDLFRED